MIGGLTEAEWIVAESHQSRCQVTGSMDSHPVERDMLMSRIMQVAGQGLIFARSILLVMAISLGVAACATAPQGEGGGHAAEVYDPLEGLNRHVFAFNDAVDTVLIRPAAFIYREATPRPIKGIVSNFLDHLTLPLTIIHDLLQGKPERAQVAFGRLFLNTVVGIGGLFDIATPAGFPMHKEDMGQTLAVHGVDSGPYLVLPILGPSSFRDGIGTAIDAFADPMTIASYGVTNGFTLRISRAAAAGLVRREQLIEPLDALRQSLDYYATVRAAYRQQRAIEVNDGAPASGEEADPFASFETGNETPRQPGQPLSDQPQSDQPQPTQ